MDRKQYMKEYREKNKEKSKLYYQANKEKYKENHKEYIKNNKEKIKEHDKEYSKEYRKTENSKKSNQISCWKIRGVKNDDFSSLYDKYINCKNCEECNVELQTGNNMKNKRVLDHDHETGLFRNVLCNSCNLIKR